MSKQQDPHQSVEELKTKGNTYFQKNQLEDAIQSYTAALRQLSIESSQSTTTTKATLLSNRAACQLKKGQWNDCIKDCTTALKSLDADNHTTSTITTTTTTTTKDSIRCKLLYRRARALFMQDNSNQSSSSSSSSKNDDSTPLNEAAKDLLKLLSIDKTNKDATLLLQTIRARHGLLQKQQQQHSPVAQTLATIKSSFPSSPKDVIHHLKVLLGLLHNDDDTHLTSMEFGRTQGVSQVMELVRFFEQPPPLMGGGDTPSGGGGGGEKEEEQEVAMQRTKIRTLALQVLACACSNPPFVWTYCGPTKVSSSSNGSSLDQHALAHIIAEASNQDQDIAVAAMSVLLRLILHLDHDKEEMDITTDSHVDNASVCRACVTALMSFRHPSSNSGNHNNNTMDDTRVVKTALDVLSSWTTTDHYNVVHAALLSDDSSSSSTATTTASKRKMKEQQSGLPHIATKEELRAMKPREMAMYKKREYERRERDKAWGKQRSLLFCDMETGGLEALLQCAIHTPGTDKNNVTPQHHHSLMREICIVLGRIMSSIDDETDIKQVVAPVFGYTDLHREESKEEEQDKKEESDGKHNYGGLTIEELKDDDDDGDDDPAEASRKLAARRRVGNDDLETKMAKGQLVSALFLGKPEIGVWALEKAWSNGQGLRELREMMMSSNNRARFIASEVISAAASVEKGRPLISGLVGSAPFQDLLEDDNREIQSGAASAIAKLGLADKNLSSNEGEVIGLLQVACQLLEDVPEGETLGALLEKSSQVAAASKKKSSSSSTASTDTTAVQRGLELVGYLASRTQIKEELAHGFRATGVSHTAIDRLVELSHIPDGDSVSSYAIASIFSSLVVSVETLKKEAFAEKEISAEQYDELQNLGKTEEEKELAKKEQDRDPPEAVHNRIRKLASSNVPRAMVKLMEGASEHTQELLVVGMTRMAIEESVRGLMVQQGVLTACIKFENGDNPSETAKKTLRHARHCIAKLLVTLNPSLLTSSQRMGAIKPLVQLIRDNESSDLQQFEALMSVTNLASMGDETKNRIVAEKGVGTLSYAMFSEHESVRQAATEAMTNLVPHPDVMKHLADPEHLRLFFAFAADYQENFPCARAAAGCLAMASQDPKIATAMVQIKTFSETTHVLLECGNLELMHRGLILVLNLVYQQDANDKDDGGKSPMSKCKKTVIEAGLVAFCAAYVESYHDGQKAANDLQFSQADQALMATTVDIAKEILQACE